MKTSLLFFLTFSTLTFAQEKIPAVDINNPPQSIPTTSVSTVEETPAATTQAVTTPNGCTMNFANYQSLFIQDKKRYLELTELEKDYEKQTLKQGAIMGNGTKVRFVKSTCNNYAIIINMTPKKIQNALPHHLYRQTSQLMEHFQLDLKQFYEIAPLKKSLVRNNWSQIKADGDQYILPCVGAKCTLKVIKVDGVDKEIEVTYDTGAL